MNEDFIQAVFLPRQVDVARSLQAMLDCFSRFLPCVRGDMQGLEELSYRFVAAQAKQNIVYTEVRYSPHLYIASFQLSFFWEQFL